MGNLVSEHTSLTRAGTDNDKLLEMIKKLEKLTSNNGVTIIFSVSADAEELPAELKAYIA